MGSMRVFRLIEDDVSSVWVGLVQLWMKLKSVDLPFSMQGVQDLTRREPILGVYRFRRYCILKSHISSLVVQSWFPVVSFSPPTQSVSNGQSKHPYPLTTLISSTSAGFDLNVHPAASFSTNSTSPPSPLSQRHVPQTPSSDTISP